MLHKTDPSIAVVLVNLGTPSEPTPKAIRQYLRAFLSDKRVIDLPRLPWAIILNAFILPFRPKQLAHAYQKIWLPEGSPLKVYGENLRHKLCVKLQAECQTKIPVLHALTYGKPDLKTTFQSLREMGIHKLIILPLYPQFSTTTTGPVFDQTVQLLGRCPVLPEFHLIHDYHQHPEYLQSIANSISTHWETQGRGELLLFSFHGLPKRYVDKGDPYIEQCQATAQGVAKLLNLNEKEWKVSFQSRFGKAEWVKPYTIDVVKELPSKGVIKLDLVSPGFAVDCLETLEELAIQNREAFCQSGGKVFHYIPALNDTDEHVNLLHAILAPYLRLS